jgi:hypothetical protein
MSKSFLIPSRLYRLMERRDGLVSKWDSLGFLDALKGHVKEDVAQLYESEASHLLADDEFVTERIKKLKDE